MITPSDSLAEMDFKAKLTGKIINFFFGMDMSYGWVSFGDVIFFNPFCVREHDGKRRKLIVAGYMDHLYIQ